jgi:hypothetical protein
MQDRRERPLDLPCHGLLACRQAQQSSPIINTATRTAKPRRLFSAYSVSRFLLIVPFVLRINQHIALWLFETSKCSTCPEQGRSNSQVSMQSTMNSNTIHGNGAYPFETWSMPQPVATHTISAERPTSTDWHPQRNHHQRYGHTAQRFYMNGSSFPRPTLPNLPPPYAQQLYNAIHAHGVVGGPVDDAPPSGGLANITNVMHVADVTENTASAQPDRAGNAGRRTIRKDLDWEGNKLRIKKIYIDDNKTLDDTMRQMDEEFGFVAS